MGQATDLAMARGFRTAVVTTEAITKEVEKATKAAEKAAKEAQKIAEQAAKEAIAAAEEVEAIAEEVVEASIEAIQSYAGPVKVNLILCTLRHFTKEQSELTADLVIKYAERGVVGLDLAADEAGYGLENHQEAFKRVNRRGICCTAHAGEARGADSVMETLSLLHVKRIGHGIRSTEDLALLERLKQENIHLEICPTSNHITRVFPELTTYPINHLLKNRNSFGINTDGRAISNVTLDDEYRWLEETKGWDINDMLYVNEQALAAAFISDREKEILRITLHEGFKSFIDSLS